MKKIGAGDVLVHQDGHKFLVVDGYGAMFVALIRIKDMTTYLQAADFDTLLIEFEKTEGPVRLIVPALRVHVEIEPLGIIGD